MTEGWQKKQIQDVADIVNGGTPKSKIPEYWNGDVLWITPKDMGQVDSIYVADTSRHITEQGLQNLQQGWFQKILSSSQHAPL